MTDAPTCRICGAAHWMREPHAFKEEVKIAAPQVALPPPDVAALVRVSMILQKRVAELEAQLVDARARMDKAREEVPIPLSNAEKQKNYRQRLKEKQHRVRH